MSRISSELHDNLSEQVFEWLLCIYLTIARPFATPHQPAVVYAGNRAPPWLHWLNSADVLLTFKQQVQRPYLQSDHLAQPTFCDSLWVSLFGKLAIIHHTLSWM